MLAGELTNYINANSDLVANQWFRPIKLNYISLESDANQFYNYMTQKIMFDTENEMIKIKYSTLYSVSGALMTFSYNKENKTLHFSNGYNYITSLKRNPKAGDIIGCFDPRAVSTPNTLAAIANVTKDYNGNITLTLVDNQESSTFLDKIDSTQYAMKFFIVIGEYAEDAFCIDNTRPYELYIEKDISTYPADIYISTDKVSGFDYSKRWGL